MLSTPDSYQELLQEVTHALEKELSRENNPIIIEKEWCLKKDHISENAIVVRGFDSKMNAYTLHTLMSTVGTVNKMWYGFKKLEKYYDGLSFHIGKLRKKISLKKSQVRNYSGLKYY